jgi:class 3 adenylate cyclase
MRRLPALRVHPTSVCASLATFIQELRLSVTIVAGARFDLDGPQSRAGLRSYADGATSFVGGRRRYPSGVEQADPEIRRLTFLFADVEGSTRLTERHGADAGEALARYHDLAASTAAAHGGRLFERIGDGAYASFPDAVSAVAAADALQSAITGHDWGPIGRLRIRIAVVTGEVEVRGDRYYGRALFRAARIQALAA